MYKILFNLVFRKMDPEKAHHLAFFWIRLADSVPGLRQLVRLVLAPRDEALRTSALGLDLPGPFGLGAGFDKDALGIDGLSMLGFDFIEIGTVTGEPQPGNPQPRLFRLVDDRALINRMGFNNQGSARVAARMAARPHTTSTPVIGVNIGKTKAVEEADAIADYVKSAERLAAHADYLVVNVSSPNTPGCATCRPSRTCARCSRPSARPPTGRPRTGRRCWSRSPRTWRTRTSTRSPTSPWSWDWTASSPPTPRSAGAVWWPPPRRSRRSGWAASPAPR